MRPRRLAILSDIHYAGAAEQERPNFLLKCVQNPAQRFCLYLYRRYYWQRDPFAHNYLLDEFLKETREAELVIALGDYSCDSGFVGLSDDAALASAQECLGRLRENFPDRFLAVMGDHELGKKPLGADIGGTRLESFHRARGLGLEPFWKRDIGEHVFVGVTSTLVSWPVWAGEALGAEMRDWETLREEHMEQIREAFRGLGPDQRVLLCCHDPTALPFLWREEAVREKLGQIERTLIGHLHSRWFLWKSRVLSGMPAIHFLGHTTKRLSRALREARHWKPFKVLLCPSLSGIELLKDGGYYTAEVWEEGKREAKFELHRLKRRR